MQHTGYEFASQHQTFHQIFDIFRRVHFSQTFKSVIFYLFFA